MLCSLGVETMSTKSILYVEDEPNDVLLLERAFKAEGLAVSMQTARDGAEALAYLSGEGELGNRTKHPMPSLVLLDLKLPRMNGLQVLVWIRAQRHLKTLPVMLFSNSYLLRHVGDAYRLGATCFVVKPSDPGELRQVARFLHLWLHHTILPPRDGRDWIAIKPAELGEHWPG